MLSAGLTWTLRPLLQRYALARPNARSSHRIPTPQGAGIAVIAATLAVGGMIIGTMNSIDLRLPIIVFAATLFIGVVGAVDDIKTVPVLPRLILQAAAVGVVLLAIPADLRLFPVVSIIIERTILLLAALWFINLVNFMDGLDWMTVAEVLPISMALVLIGLIGELPVATTIAAAALGGAMAGFAPFNRPVAKVFLGDVGSLPIGLLLGWCLLELAYRAHLAAALILPLYYLADATVTLVRRLVKREQIWVAHRSHFYQRATDNGFTVLQVVGRVFLLNAALACLAIASIFSTSTTMDVAFLATGAAAVALVMHRFATSQ